MRARAFATIAAVAFAGVVLLAGGALSADVPSADPITARLDAVERENAYLRAQLAGFHDVVRDLAGSANFSAGVAACITSWPQRVRYRTATLAGKRVKVMIHAPEGPPPTGGYAPDPPPGRNPPGKKPVPDPQPDAKDRDRGAFFLAGIHRGCIPKWARERKP